MSNKALVFLMTLAMLAVGQAETAALDLKNVLADYIVTTWSRWEALTSGAVWAIAQDEAGYLWLGTDTGLVRFDGVSFVPWNAISASPLRSAAVKAITIARDGGMWIGFDKPGGIARIQNGIVKDYGEPDGLSRAAITVLIETANRTLLAGTVDGLYELVTNRWRKIAATDALAIKAVRSAYLSRSGTLFIGSDAGVFQQTEIGRFHRLGTYDQPVLGISEDAAGRLLITDDVMGFRRLSAIATTESSEPGRGNLMLRDRRGDVWIATRGQGLWRFRHRPDGAAPGVEKANTLVGLAGDWVYALLEDREGNIWAGAPGGLSRLAPRLVTPMMNLGPVSTMEATPDGRVWVEAIDKLIRFNEPDTARGEQVRLSLAGRPVTALRADNDGALWVATARDLLKVVNGRARPVAIPPLPGPVVRIDSISPDHRGGTWLYDLDQGLIHLGGDSTRSVVDVSAHGVVLSMLTDRSERLWLTFSEGIVAVVQPDGTLRRYDEHDGIAHDVYSLTYEDRDGAIWFGGTRGISRFAGERFASLTSGSGFPGDNVCSLVQDSQGYLWIGTTFGIIRMHPDEFARGLADRTYQVHHAFYNLSDGLGGSPVRMRGRAARARDGRLWFLTSRGVTVIDPVTLGVRRAPEPVRVEAIVADGRRFGIGRLTLPPRTNRIEINYTTLELRSPQKTAFRYRLDGFDVDWVDAGARRQALYTNLAPGSYRFRVVANNNDGTWHEPGTVFEFSVAPMFYQTLWFSAAAALALGCGILATWRLRVRQVRRRFGLLLGERVRLSHEIHDTLLQGLVGVGLQFDAISMTVGSSSPTATEQLGRARQLVDRYIREARRAIWNLRSPLLETTDLVSALQHAAEYATADAVVRFDFAVSGIPVPCSPKVEEQLLRIGQEALLNAVRHAHAQHLRMELCCDDHSLTLRVSDDGCGFQLTSLGERSTHFGLVSMKERTAAVGGHFHIVTAPGRGTRIETVVPRFSCS